MKTREQIFLETDRLFARCDEIQLVEIPKTGLGSEERSKLLVEWGEINAKVNALNWVLR